jgi:hypothetical protein
MSTYEDRIVALERKVAALELRRLYDERKVLPLHKPSISER